ncbi:DNA (cytosine-5-)-methyltransferase [Gilliamella sp. B2865]|uniref:DNA (cytosine-5-)-methyltransferase n=1 Tax=Gilliamella sp. B2865 TaxID=2817984 RepID=UPI00226A9E03|nr:DNA (cytosine-5-)-methyltransferase [Gilliamella sp. B2865]MCX8678593.1 DNA (cytosine-5-)-methyltransferase [Gilliamella sp. B2865]
MNVLSLFDGMSCGRVALERANINVTKYYASEIDKYAIQVSQNNYPDIIRLGDINNWERWDIDWSSIDLILAGSPCQGFSFAGKQLAFDDKRSALFFRFAEILAHVQSLNHSAKFLLENVRMKKDYERVITSVVGVEPIMINSALVSAQNRKRLYWCNWNVDQPEDKGVLLKDIIHETRDIAITQRHRGKNIVAVDKDKSNCITSSIGRTTDREYFYKNQGQLVFCVKPFIVPFDKSLQIIDAEVVKGKIGYFRADSQANRVYSIHGKAVTLCGDAGGGAAKTGQYLFGCITPDRIEKRQNGQRFSTGEKFYTLTAQDRHGVLIDGYIRKLTPIECERLQTLPSNYTDGVSNTQRYKMLGNGWTVDVIAHILRALK